MPHGIETQVEDLSLFLEHYREVGLDPILWIGAGASAAAGYPTLAGIEEVLRRRIPDCGESGRGLIRAFTDRFSRADLGAVLQKELGEPRPFAPLHEAVARLAGAGGGGIGGLLWPDMALYVALRNRTARYRAVAAGL